MLSSDSDGDDHHASAGKTFKQRGEDDAPFLNSEPNRVCDQQFATVPGAFVIASLRRRGFVVSFDMLAMVSRAKPAPVAG